MSLPRRRDWGRVTRLTGFPAWLGAAYPQTAARLGSVLLVHAQMRATIQPKMVHPRRKLTINMGRRFLWPRGMARNLGSPKTRNNKSRGANCSFLVTAVFLAHLHILIL